MRVGADRAHLEAEHRVAVQQPQAQRQAGRPQQAGVGAGALDQLAQLQVAVQRHRLRPAHGHGILHGTVQHHGDEQQHDEVAQQRGHHFVHAQPRLEQRRNQQQQRAGQRGGQHHSGEQHGHGQVEAGAVVQAARPRPPARPGTAGPRRRCCRSARGRPPRRPGRSASAAWRGSGSDSAKREPKAPSNNSAWVRPTGAPAQATSSAQTARVKRMAATGASASAGGWARGGVPGVVSCVCLLGDGWEARAGA